MVWKQRRFSPSWSGSEVPSSRDTLAQTRAHTACLTPATGCPTALGSTVFKGQSWSCCQPKGESGKCASECAEDRSAGSGQFCAGQGWELHDVLPNSRVGALTPTPPPKRGDWGIWKWGLEKILR